MIVERRLFLMAPALYGLTFFAKSDFEEFTRQARIRGALQDDAERHVVSGFGYSRHPMANGTQHRISGSQLPRLQRHHRGDSRRMPDAQLRFRRHCAGHEVKGNVPCEGNAGQCPETRYCLLDDVHETRQQRDREIHGRQSFVPNS